MVWQDLSPTRIKAMWQTIWIIITCMLSVPENPSGPKVIFEQTPELQPDGRYLCLNGTRFSGIILEEYPDGCLKSSTHYLGGLKDGREEKWYRSGMIASQRFFKNGKKTGIHEAWWENGQPKFRRKFKNGLNEGTAFSWYMTGKPYQKNTYHAGQEEGTQQRWDEEGKLMANYVVRNGRRFGLQGTKPCGSVEK